MKHSRPMVSVIVPVYNLESYLESALDSIVNQTIVFENSIELILINDGSTDSSDEICQNAKKRYPDNVAYFKQEHRGVSVARNVGLDRASGKYVNFFDGDDAWSRDAFSASVDFLDRHHDEVDLVASKIKFFDAQTGEHRNNYKFHKTRVLKLSSEPDSPLFHVTTCIFRRQALEGLKFDARLKITEDGKFLSEFLLRKKAYGVLSETVYYYRKRRDSSSATGGKLSDKEYYTTVPRVAYLCMLDEWRDKSGHIERFMQCQILSDIAWRIRQSGQSVLDPGEELAYKDLIKEIVRKIDNRVILSKRNLHPRYKIFLLGMKQCSECRDGLLVSNRLQQSGIFLDFVHRRGHDEYRVECYMEGGMGEGGRLVLETSMGVFILRETGHTQPKESFLGEELGGGRSFEAIIHAGEKDEISAKFVAGDGSEDAIPVHVNRHRTPAQPHGCAHCVVRCQQKISEENGGRLTAEAAAAGAATVAPARSTLGDNVHAWPRTCSNGTDRTGCPVRRHQPAHGLC
ncbi:glycosyltransferase family 2 protein [Nocardia sp. NPDC049190]|uniref:glycosyltransferase family 2 protein n=1 Tax=Nocardia sp. NPDC049190 TaxID=3155650 RepID=UPI0033C3EA64